MAPLVLPPGCIVTMVTPFDSSGGVDLATCDRLVEWYIASGCVGIFSPCLSSEMFDLSEAERLAVAERVKARVAGRVCVVGTGTYGGSIDEQAAFVVKMAAHCDAVVVNTATLVPEGADDAAWQAAAAKLLELTGEVALGLYECPVPFKRLLSPALMRWCAASGRFTFHKDTCCELAPMAAKLKAVREVDSPFRLYNANAETLLPCLAQGWHGFSGISANFYPHMHAFLCAKAAGGTDVGADAAACVAVQDFISLAEATVCVNYPASAKLYLGLQASDAEPLTTARCRKMGAGGSPMGAAMFAPHQIEALAAMDRLGRRIAAEFGIKVATL